MQKQSRGPGRPITAPPPWGELAKQVGGNAELANLLGVSKSAVNRWAMGIHRVPELAKREVLKLCEEFGIEEGIDKLSEAQKEPT